MDGKPRIVSTGSYGYIMYSSVFPTICNHCPGNLGDRFFYCPEFGQTFCVNCDRIIPELLCKHIFTVTNKDGHIHYNIVQVKDKEQEVTT